MLKALEFKMASCVTPSAQLMLEAQLGLSEEVLCFGGQCGTETTETTESLGWPGEGLGFG